MKGGFLRRAASMLIAVMMLPLAVSCGESTENSFEPPEESGGTDGIKIIIGEEEHLLRDKVDSTLTEDGIYIYTREGEKVSAPKIDDNDKSFFDAAVIDGIVVAVFENGETAVIPENGYVIRFRNVGEVKINVGDSVECDAVDIENLSGRFVRFGDITIEIGHENETRTAEDTGWLYNEYWYTGNTMSNIYCTEIAVSDGKVIEINPSGDDVAGISIPKNGYVLTVGENSACERKLRKVKVGDSAELIDNRDDLYSLTRFGYSGKDRSRLENGIIIFTGNDQSTTPVGTNLTEIAVNDIGRIEAVYTESNGINKIPEGGFVISASGDAAVRLAEAAVNEAEACLGGTRSIYIIRTPLTELARLIKERDALMQAYKDSVDRLEYINFEDIGVLISEISECISVCESELGVEGEGEYYGFDGNIIAEQVKKLRARIDKAKTELIPSITLQDRAAWVTLGEHNYDGSILLHYKTQADVDHSVRYAKLLGINTLIIDNLAAGFGVYDSEVEGIVKLPQLKDIDLIKAFSDSCNREGIRLIVMVNAFSSGLSDVVYPKDHYMSIYKDKYLLTNKGRTIGPDKVITLNPADKAVQEFNLAVISEIASKYDIYGVQADYMRYPLPYYYQEHNYEDFGYNEETVSGFKKAYGKDPTTMKISDPLWEKWCEYRRNIISDYQKRFYQTVKSIDESLNVSFTCFADYRDRQIYVYQDVEKWAENGYCDAIYPMIYGNTTEYQLSYAEKMLPITEYTDLILGVGTYVKASDESISEQLIMPCELIAEGVSVFTLRYIATCGYNDVFIKSFRNQAIPTDTEDGLLIEESKKFLFGRINNLCYALRFYDGVDDSHIESLRGVIDSIDEGEYADFSELCEALKLLKQDINDGKTVIYENITPALIKAIDYIIGLE